MVSGQPHPQTQTLSSIEVLVVAPGCLLLEVDCEVASMRTMKPLTVFAYATHHQTIHFLEVHLPS